MATGSVTYRSGGIGDNAELAVSPTFSSMTSVEESISNGASATQVIVAIDVSAVKQLWISSDQNVSFRTNSNSSPADTIALLANVPYVWHSTYYSSLILGTDVTSVYIVNTSGTAATVKIKVGQDSTP